MTRQKIKNSSAGEAPEMISVTAQNVESTGFFCYMNQKKCEGYQRKLTWLKKRFGEGMQLKMLKSPEHGFIEYIPGEAAWRPIHADGYLFIQCLWVAGRSKGKGLAGALLDACIADARRLKMKGVVMVTSEKLWMPRRRILDKHGFECLDAAPPAFSLMVKKLGRHRSPYFDGNWEQKAQPFGAGLTVVRADQCPYVIDATLAAEAAAEKAGVKIKVVEMKSRDDVLRLSPSAYGVFGLVLNGQLLSYHYQLEKDLLRLLTR